MVEAIKSVDLSALTTTIETIVPVVLPIVITLTGIRKGLSFMLSMIRGA